MKKGLRPQRVKLGPATIVSLHFVLKIHSGGLCRTKCGVVCIPLSSERSVSLLDINSVINVVYIFIREIFTNSITTFFGVNVLLFACVYELTEGPDHAASTSLTFNIKNVYFDNWH